MYVPMDGRMDKISPTFYRTSRPFGAAAQKGCIDLVFRCVHPSALFSPLIIVKPLQKSQGKCYKPVQKICSSVSSTARRGRFSHSCICDHLEPDMTRIGSAKIPRKQIGSGRKALGIMDGWTYGSTDGSFYRDVRTHKKKSNPSFYAAILFFLLGRVSR